MRSTFGRPGCVAFWALILAGVSQAGPAQAFICSEVRLMGASGVIGPEHGYQFSARCSWTAKEVEKKFSIEGFSSTSTGYIITMDVVGKGKWNRKTGEATESLKITGYGATKGESGSFSGERYAKGTCNEDPFLKDPPGGSAVCKGLTVQYKSNGGPIYEMIVEPKLILLKRTISLIEAQALSSKKAASPPPPPPPAPKPQPKKEPLTIGDARGAPGGMKAAPGPVAAVAKPNLAVVGHEAIIGTNCTPPQPAVTVKLSVRNSGGTLAANKGTVYIKEIGGTTNLGSAGVLLPALPAGETRSVSIPVITSSPYSKLPGTHRLGVHLNPQTQSGQATFNTPASPYPFAVTFPAGYCQQRIMPQLPAGVTPKPGTTRGLNPQPEPPSRAPR